MYLYVSGEIYTSRVSRKKRAVSLRPGGGETLWFVKGDERLVSFKWPHKNCIQ